MLRTGKQVWEATAKRSALALRREELDFHITRYTTLVTQASVLAGFCFDGIVHIEVHPDADPTAAFVYFSSLSCAVLLALYVVCAGATLCVFGQQLALLGSAGDSLEEAVEILRARRHLIFGCGFLALLCMAIGLVSLGWLKMGGASGFVNVAFLIFVAVTTVSVARIFCSVGGRELITGTARFYHASGGYFDLAKLQPGATKGDRSGTAFAQPEPEDEA